MQKCLYTTRLEISPGSRYSFSSSIKDDARGNQYKFRKNSTKSRTKMNRKGRVFSLKRISRICRTCTFTARIRIVSLLFSLTRAGECRSPSRRDCFALISRLNIQSLHRARLARAIQVGMVFTSSWYPASRRHFHLLHVLPRSIGRWSIFRGATTPFADNSRWKR